MFKELMHAMYSAQGTVARTPRSSEGQLKHPPQVRPAAPLLRSLDALVLSLGTQSMPRTSDWRPGRG